MPSGPRRPATRRRALAALGSATAASLAGCAGVVPGTGPATVDADTSHTDFPSIRWDYPEDGPAVGYAAVELAWVDRDDPVPLVRLRCNSTVGGIAAAESRAEYVADWFRFTVGPPEGFGPPGGGELWAQPPPGTPIETRDAPGDRLVVEAPDVGTGGTYEVPLLFDPRVERVPDRFRCSVTVQASGTGILGGTVRMSDRGTLELDDADGTG
jgi:hypothetical protein